MKDNKLSIGILAHVDAGKTTLSEILLYLTGKIRKIGRVDHQDTFLDTFSLEKERGITIFSKQAVFSLGDIEVTLLDTPGHIDFSSEMERTLQVLDYAVLVINGMDGIQAHTLTLWKLLGRYHVPTFLFVNKMDQIGTDKEQLLRQLQERFSEECLDFENSSLWSDTIENMAMSDEHAMEKYLEKGTLETEDIQDLITRRKIFPVYFGSALKNMGIEPFLSGLATYMEEKKYPDIFGARIYKISRDEQGNRLTHLKITGGKLQVKDVFDDEKVDQIRIYSGNQYELVQTIGPGSICTVTGLTKSQAGQGLGFEEHTYRPYIEPVLNYRIELPQECNVAKMLDDLKKLEEEEPHLNIVWNEELSEIHAQVMGEIEIEILRSMILERFGVEVQFDSGNLVYKESIKSPVIGVGHFEPLRHYAEVHLLLEPGDRGSGMEYVTDCNEDDLDRNWQRLVLTHLKEREHIGVLTGSEITDMKITLIAGRGHLKHTEGGDFRQATYRALRQGLMKAETLLLEPVYAFRIELPKEFLGRALSDIERMYGRYQDPEFEGDWAMLEGVAPVKTMMNYQIEVLSYTKGTGRCLFSLEGYEPCHNTDEVINEKAYDPENDPRERSGSVFCKKGAGFYVPWDQVESFMHVDTGGYLQKKVKEELISSPIQPVSSISNRDISNDEVEQILRQTYGEQKRNRTSKEAKVVYGKKKKTASSEYEHKSIVAKDQYLLVDGYNIIFAWENLKETAKHSLESSRMQLLDILTNYQSQKSEKIIVVFDAYRVAGNPGSISKYHQIDVVYTKEAETADQYIERFVEKIRPDYEVTVATSDILEQVIIMGKGAKRLSAGHFKEEVDRVQQNILERLSEQDKSLNNKISFDEE
jgi:small GTP-binding protein